EAERARRRPSNGVALGIGDRNRGVVEARIHVRHARNDILALAASDAGFARLGCRCFFAHSVDPLPGLARSALRRCLLLAGDRAARLALAGARVGVGALTAYRQILAVP